MFANPIPFYLSLIFADKARSEQLEESPVRGSTLLGSSHACKYKTWVEVNGSGKHSSLLQYDSNYCPKKFYSTYPCSLYYEGSLQIQLIPNCNRPECLSLSVTSSLD